MGLVKYFLRIFSKFHVFIFRNTGGKRMNKFGGMPVLILNPIGAKSGKKRSTPLMYFEHKGNFIVTASNGGSDYHPGWFYNIRIVPQTEIETNEKKTTVVIHIADDKEKSELWQILIKINRSYEKYQKKTKRNIPMIVLTSVS